jgi:hypothetical protein
MSDPLPDTAMATGNDDGTPGERAAAPLGEEERALLDALRDTGGEDVVTDADVDDPALARAVDDGTAVPEP